MFQEAAIGTSPPSFVAPSGKIAYFCAATSNQGMPRLAVCARRRLHKEYCQRNGRVEGFVIVRAVQSSAVGPSSSGADGEKIAAAHYVLISYDPRFRMTRLL